MGSRDISIEGNMVKVVTSSSQLGTDIQYSELDTTLKGGIVPIGTILSWAKSITGIPTIPFGWAECNGSTVSDADSPINGQALPNLNGSTEANKRFLRGSTTSGTTGGASTHNHGGATGNNPNNGFGVTGSGNNSNVTHNHSISSDATIPPYYEVVFIMRYK